MESNAPISSEFKALFQDIKKYLEIKYDLAKLDIIEKMVIMTSLLFTVIIVFIFFPVVLFFLSFAVAFYLGDIWNSNYLGFLAVSGFYFIIALFVLLFRKYLITKPLIKVLIKNVFNTEQKLFENEK